MSNRAREIRSLTTGRVLVSILLLSVFLLAVTKTFDTDAWMHLGIGRLIWELKAFPAGEPFLYPMEGQPFAYSTWLFAVVYYLAWHLFGTYGVILLKASTVTLAFFILVRDALRPRTNAVVAVFVMSFVLLAASARFAERPDTFLMLFLSFSIFSLNAFVYDNRKYLYALPIISLIWANSHSSINLMLIPFGAFLVGGYFQRFVNRRFGTTGPEVSPAQARTIAVVFAASFLASLVSPYFIGQYTVGAKLLGVDWWKQEVLELLPPTWDTNKWPYVLTAATGLSFVAAGRRSSLIHALLVLPFMVLAFTAIRFIFLLAIVAGPIIARNAGPVVDRLDELFRKRKGTAGQSPGGRAWTGAAAALVALWIAASTGLSLARVQPFRSEIVQFGFGFSEAMVPKGGVDYLERNGIAGRVFNTFHWGQYIIWKGYPKRTVFVDGRGYLPVDLLEKMNLARHRKDVLDELYQAYHFESILVAYPIDEGGISGLNYDVDPALTHPGWALVYWDDNSLLYLRRNGHYQALIDRDEYRFVRPANLVTGAGARLRDEAYRVAFVKELLRNIKETGSSSAYAFLGYVYSESGLYRQAIEAYSHVRALPGRDFHQAALAGIAQAYGKLDDVDSAIVYYEKALDLNPDASLYYKLGLAYLAKDEKKKAVRHFERALELSENLLSVYPLLIGAYRDLGKDGKAVDAAARYERAQVVGKGEEHFKAGLAAYMAHSYDQAADEFARSIEVNPGNPVAYSNLGYIYYDMGLLDRAYPYQRKAVEIDPNYANAHYGLALIYKRQGDRVMARHHWEEYLRIEPAGYYSRKAREELRSLK